MKKVDIFLTVGANAFLILKNSLKVNKKNIYKGDFKRAYICLITSYYPFLAKKI